MTALGMCQSGAPWDDGPTIHSVAFAALVRRYERSVLRVRLVKGRWAPLCGVRTEPGAAETVSVIIDSPDAEPLSPVMAASYGLTALHS